MATKKERKAQVVWFGDKDHMLGSLWIHKKLRPYIFGFAKGIVLGLMDKWEKPFVLIRMYEGAELTKYSITSPYQEVPSMI